MLRGVIWFLICLAQYPGALSLFAVQARGWGNPKTEARIPKEGRSPKPEDTPGRCWGTALFAADASQPSISVPSRSRTLAQAAGFDLRISDFLRPSGFGLRVCALDTTVPPEQRSSQAVAETWQSALSHMPLNTNVTQLNRSNCVGILLRAFQSNDVVKALIFMPGATDELYFFRRARAELTNSLASLLDAVSALTNQTRIQATFRPPLLLLHSPEDLLEPAIQIEHQPTADKIRQVRFVAHGLYNDRDWNYMRDVLRWSLRADMRPPAHSHDSWHFYRHSFAAWNLTGWEAVEATALAGQEAVTVRRKQLVFGTDPRPRIAPKFDEFPR